MQRFRADSYIAAVIFLAGLFVGWAHTSSTSVAVGDIIRSTFPPAVNFACNGKLESIDPSDYSPQLKLFLEQKVDDFDCANLTSKPKPFSLDVAQYQTHHLLYATGLTWKITGISWSKLSLLLGILFGVAAVLTYGLFRLFMARGVALPMAVLAAFNPLTLAYLPYLRDYAKAPVLMAGMLVLALLVYRCKSAGRMWKLSALMGASVGIGMGFRQDALILVPLFSIVLFVLVPRHPHLNLKNKCVAAAVFLVTLGAAFYPVYPGYIRGGNSGHVMLLGQTTPFDPANNIARKPGVSSYDIGHRYDDSLMSYLVRYYAYWNHRKDIDVYPNKDYERASLEYYANLWRHFPADQVTKVLGVTLNISRLFMVADYKETLHRDIYRKIQPVIMHFDRAVKGVRGYPYSGVVVIALACLLLLTRNMKGGFLFASSFVYLSMVSSFQYDNRHVFYLQFFFWLSLGVILAGIFTLLGWACARLVSENKAPSSALHGRTSQAVTLIPGMSKLLVHKSMAGFFAFIGLIAMGVVVLLGLRAYQNNHVRELFSQYSGSPRDSVEGRIVEVSNGVVRYEPAGFMPKIGEIGTAPWKASSSAYLAAEIDFRSCKVPAINDSPYAIVSRYESSDAAHDHSRSYLLPSGGQIDGQMVIFFPAFFHSGYSRFAGMEMPRSLLPCFKLKILPRADELPMPLYITLLPDWLDRPPVKELNPLRTK